jgi:AraC-like DNA-binding protein
MHERVERHLRYQPLRFPCELSFRIEGDTCVLDVTHRGTPAELVPVVLDWAFACACNQMAQHAQSAHAPVALWLGYAEQPYHHALRALVAGNVTFGAAYNRMTFAARELQRPLAGDPHLGRLAVGQLEQRLAEQREQLPQDTLAQVRQRVRARLAVDPSLDRIAHDLGVSARTLRRQLSAHGVSFQGLLEEERRAHALAALVETDATIDVVAARLGYSESANFRRAFRRWTGMSPGAFRAASRAGGAAYTATSDDPILAVKAPATRAAQRRHSRLET